MEDTFLGEPFEDWDDLETSGDVEKGLRQMLEQKMGQLPPSEQKKLAPKVKAFIKTVAPGKKLLYETFNLREPEECYRMERLFGQEEVDVMGSQINWSPNGDLIYMAMCQVTPEFYQEVRGEFIVDEDLEAEMQAEMDAYQDALANKPSLWKRFRESAKFYLYL